MLPTGAIRALRVARLRVPEGTSEPAADLADAAQQRIIDVMMGDVEPGLASAVLKAGTHLREEICGPLAQKHEVTGAEGGPLTIKVVTYEGEDA